MKKIGVIFEGVPHSYNTFWSQNDFFLSILLLLTEPKMKNCVIYFESGFIFLCVNEDMFFFTKSFSEELRRIFFFFILLSSNRCEKYRNRLHYQMSQPLTFFTIRLVSNLWQIGLGARLCQSVGIQENYAFYICGHI